jgi:dihydroorotate dehydrogenase (NAD+) catalytic subunit
MGGIASGRDVLEFVAAGAADIALGTILFSDPGSVARIQPELANEVAAFGVGVVDNAIGLAHAGATAISESPQSAAPMSV